MDLSLSTLIVATVLLIIFLEIILIRRASRTKKKCKDVENIVFWLLSFREDYNSNQIPAIPKIDKLLRRNLGNELTIREIHFGNYQATHEIKSIIPEKNIVYLNLILTFPQVVIDIKPEKSHILLHNLVSEIEVKISKSPVTLAGEHSIYDTNITSVKPIKCKRIKICCPSNTKRETKILEKRIGNLLEATSFSYYYQLKVTKFSENLKNDLSDPFIEEEIKEKAKEITEEIIPKACSVALGSCEGQSNYGKSSMCKTNQNVPMNEKGHVFSNYIIEPIKRSKFTLSQCPLKSEVPVVSQKKKSQPLEQSEQKGKFDQSPIDMIKQNDENGKSSLDRLNNAKIKYLKRLTIAAFPGFRMDATGNLIKDKSSVQEINDFDRATQNNEMNDRDSKIRVGNLLDVKSRDFNNTLPDPTYDSALSEDERVVRELERDLASFKKAPLANINEVEFNDKEFVESFPVKPFTAKKEKINFMLDPLDQSSWNHSIIDDKVPKTIRMDSLLKRNSGNNKISLDNSLDIMPCIKRKSSGISSEIINDQIYRATPQDQQAYIPKQKKSSIGRKSSFLTKTVPCIFNERDSIHEEDVDNDSEPSWLDRKCYKSQNNCLTFTRKNQIYPIKKKR